jgi:hypothetical protein
MMTPEKFWKHYEKDSILDVYDIALSFFSDPISPQAKDEYDYQEVILEVAGEQAMNKQFIKVRDLATVLGQKHPDIYDHCFPFLHQMMVDYYSFCGNRVEAEAWFAKLHEQPMAHYECFIQSLKKLLYYGHTSLVEKTIATNYENIKNDEEMGEAAEFELAMIMYSIIMEQNVHFKNNVVHFTKDSFAQSLRSFDFNIDEKSEIPLSRGFHHFDFSSADFASSFKQNIHVEILSIEAAYLLYMKKMNIDFATSDRIWNLLNVYLKSEADNKKLSPADYFKLQYGSFDAFVSDLASSFFDDDSVDMIALIWGCVYVFDFLLARGIIGQASYDHAIDVSRKLKRSVIIEFAIDLWNYNFVNLWHKPSGVSTEEAVFMKDIFERSFPVSYIDEPTNNLDGLLAYVRVGLEKLGYPQEP